MNIRLMWRVEYPNISESCEIVIQPLAVFIVFIMACVFSGTEKFFLLCLRNSQKYFILSENVLEVLN